MAGAIKIKQLHRKLSDDAYEKAFADKTLRPGWFTHEAHLRLAYIHILKYGYEGALANMRAQIKAFAENLGIYDKYHDTVTIIAVVMTAEAMENAQENDFINFIEGSGRYLLNFKALLNNHYSYNLFKDLKSRKEWVAPDLKPFPQQFVQSLQPSSATK